MTAENSDLWAVLPRVGHSREEARVVQGDGVGSFWGESCRPAGVQVESPLLGILMPQGGGRIGRDCAPAPLLPSPASRKIKQILRGKHAKSLCGQRCKPPPFFFRSY